MRARTDRLRKMKHAACVRALDPHLLNHFCERILHAGLRLGRRLERHHIVHARKLLRLGFGHFALGNLLIRRVQSKSKRKISSARLVTFEMHFARL